jgi:hypothetical protein
MNNNKTIENATNHCHVVTFCELQEKNSTMITHDMSDHCTEAWARSISNLMSTPKKSNVFCRDVAISMNVALQVKEKSCINRISKDDIQRNTIQLSLQNSSQFPSSKTTDVEEGIKRPLQRRRSNYNDEYNKRENDRLKARETASHLIRTQRFKKEFSGKSKRPFTTSSGKKIFKRKGKRTGNEQEKPTSIPSIETATTACPDTTPKIRLHAILPVSHPTISKHHRPFRQSRRHLE